MNAESYLFICLCPSSYLFRESVKADGRDEQRPSSLQSRGETPAHRVHVVTLGPNVIRVRKVFPEKVVHPVPQLGVVAVRVLNIGGDIG